MQESIGQKQQFLRNQILEGGFNPEQFMIFMGLIKNESENIDLQNWTIAQLRQVVVDFKRSVEDQFQMQKSKIDLEASRGSKQMMTSKIVQSVMRKNKVFYNYNDLWDYQIYNQQQCKQLQQYFEFKVTPEIDYKSWDIKKTGGIIFGFGATNQLEITFITNFTSAIVTRKSEDIDWLRETLANKFPGSFIPPLEPIREVLPQDKSGIMKYVKQAIFFLNSLLSFDYLVQNKYFHAFIDEGNPLQFKAFVSRENAVKVNADIGSIETIDGHFSVQISERVLNFIKNSSNYAQGAQQIYRSIQSNIRKVMGDLQTLTKHCHYIANDFAKLHQRHTKMAQSCKIKGPDNKDEQLSKIFIYLNNMFTTLGNQKKKSISLLRQFSDEFLRYAHSQWTQFLTHSKKYQNNLNSYLNFKYNLLKKKQRNISDYTKWELDEHQKSRTSKADAEKMEKQQLFQIMYPKENKTEEEMRIWQAFINQMYEKSYRVLINEQQKMYMRYCSRYCIKNEKFLQEQAQFYSKFHTLFEVGALLRTDSQRKKSHT